VVGTSRKSFLGRVIAQARGGHEPVDVQERLPGTIATSVLAYERGARVLRVHDVAPVRAALALAAATLAADG
jgi:dihydropteroate synthase